MIMSGELQLGVLAFCAGVIVGCYAMRRYLRSVVQKRTISDIINYEMIKKSVGKIDTVTESMNSLLVELKIAAEELAENMERTRDIEEMSDIV